jgi:hypothetical protein
MDQDEINRFGAKKFAIGVNVGRKEERQRTKAEARKQYKKGLREGERKARARQGSEDGWRKVRVPQWLVFGIASSIVGSKLIDVLFEQLSR